jgi:hypothetical protein
MLGSAHAGERDAAALAADKLVRERGLTWLAILSIEPSESPANLTDAECIAVCMDRADLMTPWEINFLTGVARQVARGRRLSSKQRSVLHRLYAMAREHCP